MYTVHCIVYILEVILQSIFCRVYITFYILWNVDNTPYAVHRTPYTVHRTLYAVHRASYIVYSTTNSVLEYLCYYIKWYFFCWYAAMHTWIVCAWYAVYFKLYTEYLTLYWVCIQSGRFHCTLFIVQCTLYSVHCIMCIICISYTCSYGLNIFKIYISQKHISIIIFQELFFTIY